MVMGFLHIQECVITFQIFCSSAKKSCRIEIKKRKLEILDKFSLFLSASLNDKSARRHNHCEHLTLEYFHGS